MDEIVAKFAVDRSHKASEIAYDLCKVTAQACLLINGGAATAVIALLSKEKLNPGLLSTIPASLVLYGLGVFFSAAMMFSTMMNADYWNYHCYYTIYEQNSKYAESSATVADRWHHGIYWGFGLAVICFLAASGVLAHAI